MKKIVYLLEFILIKILFIFFQIIGYRLSSNLGFFIGKKIGPIFRSKKMIIQNLEKANIQNQENLKKIASNVLGNYGRIFAEYIHLRNFRNDKLRKYISGEVILSESVKESFPNKRIESTETIRVSLIFLRYNVPFFIPLIFP